MEASQLARIKRVFEIIRNTNTRDRSWYIDMADAGLSIISECEHSVPHGACFACGSPASGEAKS
jgi:hypothetical protein